MRLRCLYIACCLAGLWLVLAGPYAAQAQRSGQGSAVPEGAQLVPSLGASLPLDLVFQDETGQDVALQSYFAAGRPVLLNFVYFDCPMLCSLVLQQMTETLQDLDWTPGETFEVVTVSFAANETPALAAEAKARYLALLGRPEAADGWHFLTGSEAAIAQLAEATGFAFEWDETTQQYAHPAALMFVAPDGTLTRYLFGLTYAAGDVRKALVEASEGTVGTLVDQFLLYCFQYDAGANAYVLEARNLMKLGGLLTIIVLGGGLFIFWRRENARVAAQELRPAT